METDEKLKTNAAATSAVPPATGTSNINVGSTERIVSAITGGTLTVLGLRNIRERNGIIMTVAGGLLLFRGVTGFCPVNKAIGRNTANKKARAIEVIGIFTINKPKEEVYAFWRNFENLPTFMKHLKLVTAIDDKRSSWKARVPGGMGTISWDAEIVEDQPNSYLSWCSLPGSTIDNAGEVRFTDAPGNRGTEVCASITYRMPAGDVGSAVGRLFSPVVEQLVTEDLRRFKSIMETGEAPTIKGQPSGRVEYQEQRRTHQERSRDFKTEDYESTVLERDQ